MEEDINCKKKLQLNQMEESDGEMELIIHSKLDCDDICCSLYTLYTVYKVLGDQSDQTYLHRMEVYT